LVPGLGGGANWSGAAIDPETGMLYVGTYRLPFLVTVRKPKPGESSYDYIGEFRHLPGPRGLPLLKPPFGSIVAIEMHRRASLAHSGWAVRAFSHNPATWRPRTTRVPRSQLGAGDEDGDDGRADGLLRRPADRAGDQPARSAIFSTSSRICGCTTRQPAQLAEIPLPANATGSPITYMAAGKQYIVFPVGGGPLVEELVAIAL